MVPVGIQAQPLAAAPAEDERALIAAARSDPRAFGELYQRHYAAIGGYIYRRVGNPAVTEDLVADVFTRALDKLSFFRWSGVSFRFWLLRIATNAVNGWVRRAARERSALKARAETLVSSSASDSPAATQADAVQRALLRLAPQHQAVLALHYLEGLSLGEVARILGCRLGTVKSRLARARDELRGLLAAGGSPCRI